MEPVKAHAVIELIARMATDEQLGCREVALNYALRFPFDGSTNVRPSRW